MARKTYSVSFGGATTGEATVAGKPIGWDTDAAGFEGALNAFVPAGGFGGWTVTGGSGSFTIEQPEECGNYDLSANVSQNTLDASPSCTVTQQWTPTVNLSVDDNTISEPSGVAVVTFAIAATHTASVSVGFSMGGTATQTTDYTKSTTSPVVIASGESTATMSITVVDDHTVEDDETVTVTLSSITGGESGTSSVVTITISSDDIAGPTMVISAPSGLTLTAKIFARGSDTLIETVTLAERTNCLGIYEGNVVEGETGWHHVSIFSGADCIGVQDIYLTAAEIEHYAGDYCPIEDPSGLLSTVGPSAASIRSAVGLASANLDTQLNATATTATAIKTKTDYLPSATSGASGGLVIGSGTGTITLTSGGLPKVVDASGANVAAASSIPTLAGIASTVAAVVPTNASIASTVSAVLPTNSSIAATVASAITADHGSGAYTTANVSSLATTAQLASSSATLLAAIPSISTLATTSQLAASSAALLTQVNLAIATSAAILDDTGTSGVVVATASKTGYALASDGLDSISTTAPSGVATNFRQMVVQTWRRLFKKTTLTSTQLKTYADDGTTVVTTQAVTNSGGIETVGNAS